MHIRKTAIILLVLVEGCYLSHTRESDPSVCSDAEPPSTSFYFCEPWSTGGAPEGTFGYRGCCTDGSFMTADRMEPGMLVKGSGHAVYYIASDNRRYVFASSHYLASWFLRDDSGTVFGEDARSCGEVSQITDELLASIPIGGNVPMRPGVILTGIATDPHRWAVDHGNVLREIDDPAFDMNLAEPCLASHEILTPDFLFTSFELGTPVSDTAHLYDGVRLYDEAVVDDEIRTRYGW